MDETRADRTVDEPVSGVAEFRASVDEAKATLRAFLDGDGASKRQFIGDLIALAPLVAMLLWMSTHDGGYEPAFRRSLTLVVLLASPVAALELRSIEAWPRRLIAWWYIGLIAVWALAGERNFWVTSSIPLVITPAIGLYAHRIWRRPWGPAALLALLLLAFGSYAYRSFLAWWGDAMRGRQPLWRPLSWHNQSGVLMGAFGAAFLGASLASRTTIAAVTAAAGGAALATTWLAGSRGAAVAAALGVAVVILAAVRGRVARSTWLIALGGAAIAAAVTVIGLTALEDPDALPSVELGSPGSIPSERIGGRSLAADQSLSRRLLHADAAFGMFVDRPVRGQGIGSYRVQSLEFTDPDARLTSSAHNEYIEVLGEGGLLYGLPFLALHVLIGGAALRRRIEPADPGRSDPDFRSALRAAGVGLVVVIGAHAAIDFDWFYPVLPALLAIGAATTSPARPTDETSTSDAGPWPVTILAGIVLIVAIGAVWGGDLAESRANAGRAGLTAEEVAEVPLPWQGERALGIAVDLAQRDEPELATQVIDEAVAWNPAVDDYEVLSASFRYRSGELSGEDLVLALADSSAQFRAFNLVAEALIDEGDLNLARNVLDVVMERYERYTNWGIGGVRAESWYLVVRADSEAGACELAREDAAAAIASGAYAQDDAETELQPLIDAACGVGAAG